MLATLPVSTFFAGVFALLQIPITVAVGLRRLRTDIHFLDGGNVRLGSKLAFVAQFLGRRLAYTYEVVEFEPGRMLVMRTAQGPFPMETTYTWEPAGRSSTRMTLRNRGEPNGFSKLVAPFMAAAMRRANAKDLARLKSLLEQSD